MCDKQRSARSISVPGANNRLLCPVDDVIVTRKQASYKKPIQQRWRMSMQNIKLRVT